MYQLEGERNSAPLNLGTGLRSAEKCLDEKLEKTNYTSINIKSWCSADIEIKVKRFEGRSVVRSFCLSDKQPTPKR